MSTVSVSTKTVFALSAKIHVSPACWPERKLDVRPGDLLFGYTNRKAVTPFSGAASCEESGGVVYFGNSVVRADFEALMRVVGTKCAKASKASKDFAVFTVESDSPGKGGYLTQMRIVSKIGLLYMFRAITDEEYEKFPEQNVSIVDAFWEFMQVEKDRWGTYFGQDKEKGLRGLFGGDGDQAREELAFGLMVESSLYGVYRIWSRAWLVHK